VGSAPGAPGGVCARYTPGGPPARWPPGGPFARWVPHTRQVGSAPGGPGGLVRQAGQAGSAPDGPGGQVAFAFRCRFVGIGRLQSARIAMMVDWNGLVFADCRMVVQLHWKVFVDWKVI
jgi:hypothetical protein